MNTWYFVATDQQRHGPVSDAQLAAACRNGRVTLDSLVWQAGMTDWQPLRQFAAQLQLTGAAVPPAITSSPALASPLCKKSRKTLIALTVLSLVPPLPLFGLPHFYMRAWGIGLFHLGFVLIFGILVYFHGNASQAEHIANDISHILTMHVRDGGEILYSASNDGVNFNGVDWANYLINKLKEKSLGIYQLCAFFMWFIAVSFMLVTAINFIRYVRMSPAQFQTRLQTFKPGPLAWF